MPFKSKAQARYMFAAEERGDVPEGTAHEWAEHTPDMKELPDYVKKPKKTQKKQAISLPVLTKQADNLKDTAPPNYRHSEAKGACLGCLHSRSQGTFCAQYNMEVEPTSVCDAFQPRRRSSTSLIFHASVRPNAGEGSTLFNKESYFHTPASLDELFATDESLAAMLKRANSMTQPPQPAMAPSTPQNQGQGMPQAQRPQSRPLVPPGAPPQPVLGSTSQPPGQAQPSQSMTQAPPAAPNPQQLPGAFQPSSLFSTVTTQNSPATRWQAGVHALTTPQGPPMDPAQQVASGQQLQANQDTAKRASFASMADLLKSGQQKKRPLLRLKEANSAAGKAGLGTGLPAQPPVPGRQPTQAASPPTGGSLSSSAPGRRGASFGALGAPPTSGATRPTPSLSPVDAESPADADSSTASPHYDWMPRPRPSLAPATDLLMRYTPTNESWQSRIQSAIKSPTPAAPATPATPSPETYTPFQPVQPPTAARLPTAYAHSLPGQAAYQRMLKQGADSPPAPASPPAASGAQMNGGVSPPGSFNESQVPGSTSTIDVPNLGRSARTPPAIGKFFMLGAADNGARPGKMPLPSSPPPVPSAPPPAAANGPQRGSPPTAPETVPPQPEAAPAAPAAQMQGPTFVRPHLMSANAPARDLQPSIPAATAPYANKALSAQPTDRITATQAVQGGVDGSQSAPEMPAYEQHAVSADLRNSLQSIDQQLAELKPVANTFTAAGGSTSPYEVARAHTKIQELMQQRQKVEQDMAAHKAQYAQEWAQHQEQLKAQQAQQQAQQQAPATQQAAAPGAATSDAAVAGQATSGGVAGGKAPLAAAPPAPRAAATAQTPTASSTPVAIPKWHPTNRLGFTSQAQTPYSFGAEDWNRVAENSRQARLARDHFSSQFAQQRPGFNPQRYAQSKGKDFANVLAQSPHLNEDFLARWYAHQHGDATPDHFDKAGALTLPQAVRRVAEKVATTQLQAAAAGQPMPPDYFNPHAQVPQNLNQPQQPLQQQQPAQRAPSMDPGAAMISQYQQAAAKNDLVSMHQTAKQLEAYARSNLSNPSISPAEVNRMRKLMQSSQAATFRTESAMKVSTDPVTQNAYRQIDQQNQRAKAERDIAHNERTQAFWNSDHPGVQEARRKSEAAGKPQLPSPDQAVYGDPYANMSREQKLELAKQNMPVSEWSKLQQIQNMASGVGGTNSSNQQMIDTLVNTYLPKTAPGQQAGAGQQPMPQAQLRNQSPDLRLGIGPQNRVGAIVGRAQRDADAGRSLIARQDAMRAGEEFVGNSLIPAAQQFGQALANPAESGKQLGQAFSNTFAPFRPTPPIAPSAPKGGAGWAKLPGQAPTSKARLSPLGVADAATPKVAPGVSAEPVGTSKGNPFTSSPQPGPSAAPVPPGQSPSPSNNNLAQISPVRAAGSMLAGPPVPFFNGVGGRSPQELALRLDGPPGSPLNFYPQPLQRLAPEANSYQPGPRHPGPPLTPTQSPRVNQNAAPTPSTTPRSVSRTPAFSLNAPPSPTSQSPKPVPQAGNRS